MCLALPMRVDEIHGFVARCSAKGVERDVNLFLLEDEPLAAGDHVLVHVGYAIQKVSEEDARTTWDLFDELMADAAE
ncbi:MAG: HypC/HybG/HupF family hydrogenase formation chaperone [Rhodospirillales bacterium]|jgi:hydrogenase expression/formation protein HypC|nr:HypC/HybG/HupF family hydrogenase formation chaperone [Rhodospirillales bacterium]